jgi:integrase
MNVLIDTMARINEVLTIKVSDIDLTNRTIVIRPEVTKTRKGRKQQYPKILSSIKQKKSAKPTKGLRNFMLSKRDLNVYRSF